jgi:hypothetical protein
VRPSTWGLERSRRSSRTTWTRGPCSTLPRGTVLKGTILQRYCRSPLLRCTRNNRRWVLWRNAARRRSLLRPHRRRWAHPDSGRRRTALLSARADGPCRSGWHPLPSLGGDLQRQVLKGYSEGLRGLLRPRTDARSRRDVIRCPRRRRPKPQDSRRLRRGRPIVPKISSRRGVRA